MNIPNTLVVIRMLFIPVMIFCIFAETFPLSILALALIILFIIFDYVDGIIARKKRMVTKFGSFWDQLSDKLMINTMLVAFAYAGLLPLWMVLLNLAREFVVHETRIRAKTRDIILVSETSGKAKAGLQMLTILVGLFLIMLQTSSNNILNSFAIAYSEAILFLVFSATLIVAYYALFEFLYKNRDFIRNIP